MFCASFALSAGDLLFLYRYMDAATDPKAPAVTAERVAHCGWLKGEVDKVVSYTVPYDIQLS